MLHLPDMHRPATQTTMSFISFIFSSNLSFLLLPTVNTHNPTHIPFPPYRSPEITFSNIKE